MDYRSLAAPLTVLFRYTALAPGAAGQAVIEPNRIAWRIHATFTNLPSASKLGPPLLAYVLWAVTPDGRATNLGEIDLAGGAGKLNGKMVPGRFGLIVTAEPYFAVSRPAKSVVLEADLAPGAKPVVPVSLANCGLLTEAVGATLVDAGPPTNNDPAAPIVIEEARRAIEVAKKSGAGQFAPGTLATAEHLLQLARDQQARGVARKDVVDTGSEAALVAEDARVLAAKRQRDSHPQPDASN